eukprot:TRINITY_DN1556_c0_g1_i1.p1 TRINITY_DN1556_c0_g1~~TRINITY_DN1556_c0_g1_i1.p1  ORF type:complete len:466 (+),score=126.55 TRINITY_DN1556_c0_g1_i1:100-1497(+)
MADTDIVGNFMAITGVEDEAVAIMFLQDCDFKLDVAVNQFQAQSLMGSSNMSPQVNRNQPTKIPTSLEEEMGLLDATDRMTGNSKRSFEPNLQQYYDPEGIRAPIPTTREVLSEDPGGDQYFSFYNNPSRNRGFNPSAPNHVFDMLNPRTNFKERTQKLEGKDQEPDISTKKVKRLEDLFRPPVDIMLDSDFETAKNIAMRKNQWLLVNIQDSEEFNAQRLNRDTWSDAKVKDTVKNNFIFWQKVYNDEAGARFCRFYPVTSRPQISIIDPRTGELVKSWNGFREPNDLIMDLLDFIESHQLDDVNGVKETIPSKEKKPVFKEPKSYMDMTEDEQIAAAIAATMPKQEQNNDVKMEDIKQDIKQDIKVEEKKEEKIEKPMMSREGEGDCSIQIRETNGNTMKRQFQKTDTVQMLYDFVSQYRTDGNAPFQLMTTFPKKTFTGEMLSMTLQQADLTPRANVIVALL